MVVGNDTGAFLNRPAIDIVNKTMIEKEMYKEVSDSMKVLNNLCEQSRAKKDSMIVNQKEQLAVKDTTIKMLNEDKTKLKKENKKLGKKLKRTRTIANVTTGTTIGAIAIIVLLIIL